MMVTGLLQLARIGNVEDHEGEEGIRYHMRFIFKSIHIKFPKKLRSLSHKTQKEFNYLQLDLQTEVNCVSKRFQKFLNYQSLDF